jgi:hypothetical protein
VTIGQNELQACQAKRSGEQLRDAIETFRMVLTIVLLAEG